MCQHQLRSVKWAAQESIGCACFRPPPPSGIVCDTYVLPPCTYIWSVRGHKVKPDSSVWWHGSKPRTLIYNWTWFYFGDSSWKSELTRLINNNSNKSCSDVWMSVVGDQKTKSIDETDRALFGQHDWETCVQMEFDHGLITASHCLIHCLVSHAWLDTALQV